MKLSNEIEEQVVRFDLELSKDEFLFLRQLGFQEIQKDDQALVEYAVKWIFEQQVKSLGIDLEEDNGRENNSSGTDVHNTSKQG